MKQGYTEKEAAFFLGISRGSVRNWVRQGYLHPQGREFLPGQLKDLKKQIEEGTINRLNRRANKSQSKNQFIPREYLTRQESGKKIKAIGAYILSHGIPTELSLFVLALNLFQQAGEAVPRASLSLGDWPWFFFKRKSVKAHCHAWAREISLEDLNRKEVQALYQMDLPGEVDILGLLYQTLLQEREKSALGSYYTPPMLAERLVEGNIKAQDRVLDPCCGTGPFLAAFARMVKNPENIYGFDKDERALAIARTNLFLCCPHKEFTPRIYSLNTLLENKKGPWGHLFGSFDFIATNPPWGARYPESLAAIKKNFPRITGKESFSFFLCQAHNLLKNKGVMALLFPESLSNIKAHREARQFILEETTIQKIEFLGRPFKNVFSSVLSLQLQKEKPGNPQVRIYPSGEPYSVRQKRFHDNPAFLFDLYVKEEDEKIFQKILKREYTTLKGKARWGLGIVTGNNQKYLREEGGEPLYKGSDIEPYVLKSPSHYIDFQPGLFQQTAPVERYRAREKLLYRFVSSRLVFAYDNQQSLTLNSANILIPRLPSHSLLTVLAFLNSQIFYYYFGKKFHSLKILRGDMEQLPFPLLSRTEKKKIEALARRILAGEKLLPSMDRLLLGLYPLTAKEKERILSYSR